MIVMIIGMNNFGKDQQRQIEQRPSPLLDIVLEYTCGNHWYLYILRECWMADIYSVMRWLVDFHQKFPISSGYQAIIALDLLRGAYTPLVGTSQD